MKTQPKIIAFTLLKGGVAKSTCLVNIAATLSTRKPSKYSKRKNKVLILDLDTNSSASHYLGVHKQNSVGMYHVLTHQIRLDEIIQTVSFDFGNKGTCNIDIARTDDQLGNFASEWDDYNCSKTLLIEALSESETINKYDYIFVDCPSDNISILSNVYNTCEYFVFPLLADKQSYDTIDKTYRLINNNTVIDYERKYVGCIINNYQKEIGTETFRNLFLESQVIPCFETVIPHSRRMDETRLAHMPVPFFHRNIGAIRAVYRAFNLVTDEFLYRLNAIDGNA